MNKLKSVASSVTRKYSVKLYQAKQNSPAIMFGVGVVGVVATVVLASRATLKLEEALDETQANVQKAEHLWENGHDGKAFYVDENEYKKDVTVAYIKGGINVAKLYAPAFIVGAAAIGCLTGAHVTLTKRNGALMAAYVGLEQAFKKYEDRVKEEFGEAKARELKLGVEEREVYSEKKNGEPVVKTVKTAKGDHPYARFFSPSNPNWNPTPEFNMLFIRGQQTYWNDHLQTHGYVLLNDVYAALGLERSSAGAVVGWVYGKDLPGDNYIDFGCWSDENMDKFADFMVGREDHLLLDFNVAGPVSQLIDQI